MFPVIIIPSEKDKTGINAEETKGFDRRYMFRGKWF
jgi:hypothetical protein